MFCRGTAAYSAVVRSEDRIQDHLLTIVDLQRLAKDFRRGHFSK